MSVLKYKDPTTGEIKKLFAPVNEGYTKEETNSLLNNKLFFLYLNIYSLVIKDILDHYFKSRVLIYLFL